MATQVICEDGTLYLSYSCLAWWFRLDHSIIGHKSYYSYFKEAMIRCQICRSIENSFMNYSI